MDSHIAILGYNGTGKSALLNLIAVSLQPCEHTVTKYASPKLSEYSQHSADQFSYEKSPPASLRVLSEYVSRKVLAYGHHCACD